MALPTSSAFSAFDVTDGAQDRDISPVLTEAIFFDLNALSEGFIVADNEPVFDTTYRWNDDKLNTLTVQLNGSISDTATSITLDDTAVLDSGDLLVADVSGGLEVIEVTNVDSATAATVVRGYEETTGASLADNTVLKVIKREQEFSDIGTDETLNPTVYTNYTHILRMGELKVSGSQLARRMATNELNNFVAHQLANRAIEGRMHLTTAALYSYRSTTGAGGSDTALRAMGGLWYWARQHSGVVDSTAEAVSLTDFNANYKSVVDKGEFPDTILVGTDLVPGIAAIESTSRRMLESDRVVGRYVEEIVTDFGGNLRVIIDSRVRTGDYFMYKASKVKLKPMNGRGMFTIAAKDFKDGKMRRILGEWTAEVRNPECIVYAYSKTAS